jgi:hypothetical protein
MVTKHSDHVMIMRCSLFFWSKFHLFFLFLCVEMQMARSLGDSGWSYQPPLSSLRFPEDCSDEWTRVGRRDGGTFEKRLSTLESTAECSPSNIGKSTNVSNIYVSCMCLHLGIEISMLNIDRTWSSWNILGVFATKWFIGFIPCGIIFLHLIWIKMHSVLHFVESHSTTCTMLIQYSLFCII